MAQERFAEALPLLESAADNGESPAMRLTNVAICYAMLRDYTAAEKTFNEALQADPTFPMTLFELGGMYWNSGRPTDAERVWLTAIKNFPDDERVENARSNIQMFREAPDDYNREMQGFVTFQELK
jgi:tetratricopeptide (TPR) repeat protein